MRDDIRAVNRITAAAVIQTAVAWQIKRHQDFAIVVIVPFDAYGCRIWPAISLTPIHGALSCVTPQRASGLDVPGSAFLRKCSWNFNLLMHKRAMPFTGP